jgi:hypothetical protein
MVPDHMIVRGGDHAQFQDPVEQARQILDRCGRDPMVMNDQHRAVEDDLKKYEAVAPEYKRWRHVMTTNVTALKDSIKVGKDRLKQLNNGLAELNKNKPVFVSPADSKTYKQYQTEFTNLIKDSMVAVKKLEDLQRACEAALK